MKDFILKGIFLENMVGEILGKEKGMIGKILFKMNQIVVLMEDLKWELWMFVLDYCCRGVKILFEMMIECFVREDGMFDWDKLERFWWEYVKK